MTPIPAGLWVLASAFVAGIGDLVRCGGYGCSRTAESTGLVPEQCTKHLLFVRARSSGPLWTWWA
ncbi:MAG: hypothetical protein ACT4NP_11515 [Pseudonocardiales bacterium]